MINSNKLTQIDNDEKFNEYYRAKILPLKQELEKLRTSKLVSLRNRAIILVVMIVVIIYFYEKDFEKLIFIAPIIIFQLIITILPVIQYNNVVKETIYPLVFNYFGHFKLESGGIDEIHITNSRLFDYYDVCVPDDYIVGTYKDVAIEICEITIQEWRQFNKRRYLYTTFKGVFIRLDVYKNFSGNTVIMPDTLFSPNSVAGLERVKLEDTKFEKEFDVYGDDQVEARYLVTPTFMERLVKLTNLYKNLGLGLIEKYVNSDFKCSFINSSLYIAIPCSTDLFETNSIFKEAIRDKDIFVLVNELRLILQVIDQLKIDKKLRI